MIELNCTGKLEGMYVKVREDMIARVSFKKATGHTAITLKEDKVCELFSSNKKRLVGCMPCGAEIAVKGDVEEVGKKLGFRIETERREEIPLLEIEVAPVDWTVSHLP
jgi:hypothetical protein